MKGFAATPIIFIAVFLITAMLFIHFMDIDKQVAEGIGKEARLRKLQVEVMKNQTAGANELYFCGIYGAQAASNENSLEDDVKTCTGRLVDAHKISNGFTLDYKIDYNSGLLIDATLEEEVTVSEQVNYPFFELVDAANNFNPSKIGSKGCSNFTFWFVSNQFSNMEWYANVTWGSCSWKDASTLSCPYSLEANRMMSGLSYQYPHMISGKTGTLECKYDFD